MNRLVFRLCTCLHCLEFSSFNFNRHFLRLSVTGSRNADIAVLRTINMKKRYLGQLNKCGLFIKYALLIGNFVFGLAGCIAVGMCIYIAADKVYFVTVVIGTSLVTVATYLVLAGACILLLASFLGCFGSIYENRKILFTYVVCLSVAFSLSVLGSSMAIVFRSWTSDQIRGYMRNALQIQYGMNGTDNELVTHSWDTAQEKWYCCAVEDQSWGIYRSSEWYKIQPGVPDATKLLVPESCCVKDQYGKYVQLTKCQIYMTGPPGLQSGNTNEALFYRGCFTAGLESLHVISGYIIGIGVAIAFLMICGILLSTWLFLTV